MTDKELQKLINKTIRQKRIFFELVDELENEYVNRFGHRPSDVDDDMFIDTFHMRQGSKMTVKLMTESAQSCKQRKL
ncbi:MAG: hypothetical protein GY756_27035 [bacterium]|nr:hypothetical protein [bacterium]